MRSQSKHRKGEPSPEHQQTSNLYLQAVLESDTAVKALAYYRNAMAVPGDLPAPVFFARLYETLLDHVLTWLDDPPAEYRTIPEAPNPLAERPVTMDDAQVNRHRRYRWRVLYRLDRDVDPFYFSKAQVLGAIQAGPELPDPRPQIIYDIVSRYFRLRAEGFLSSYPNQVVSREDLMRWVRIFPSAYAWNSLNILGAMRLLGIGSRMGVRAYRRFFEGRFSPDYDYPEWLFWLNQIQQWCDAGANVRGEKVTADELGFLCNVFAGRSIALGFYGPCGKVPDCKRCPLETDCRWAHNPVQGQSLASETLALVRRGRAEDLSNARLLQAVLDLPSEDVPHMEDLLAGVPLRELAGYSTPEMERLLGEHRMTHERMSLLFELARRINEERLQPGQLFRTPWDIFRHFRIRMRDLKQEQFIVVMLDRKRQFLKELMVSQGTLDASPVHPREVFKAAIRESAASILVVHNHPSGDPTPSNQDLSVTRHLRDVGEMVGIPILDHVIIADERYISLSAEGLLER